ncbi:hypothetical protein N4G70_32105 [Streptomyces sp. ASQP_92]|nr:hypothetical protein [Streptomyces sp. ASQP_92]MCT9093477.1 hypothetical protein [Streptomyces sp. ASQP_92]
MSIHVVADDAMPHFRGTYSQRKPYIALTSDDYLHVSSYSVAVLE